MEAIQLLKFILDDIQAKGAVGTTINNQYHLEKLIGKGGFGAAYLAVDKKAPKNAPKKVLKRVMVETENIGNKSVVRTEAALLAKLSHPYIVKFHESFFDKNIFCIISEYCEGGDLADQIEKLEKSDRAFGDQMVEKIAYQLLCALNYLHTKKVLHRDLKPANVLLKGGDVKLTDFGVSKKLGVQEYLTKTLTGTILYVAPEILEEKPYSTKCDLWSLGVVFYEICTLKHPFESNIAAILTGSLPTLPNQAHQRILSKMLVRQTDQRCNAIDILKDPVFSNIRKNSDIEVRMVPRAEVNLFKGDITKENVDAIVIGVAKQDLTNLGNSPLAGAVLKAAGKELQDDCNASAASKPDMWSVVQVNSHQLPCIRVYIVLMEHYNENNSEKIKKSYSAAVKKCLENAEGNGFS
uniref:non-specific serine/threonine protein kinase n=2 Tax=Ciona intestinalis TaxID=7719 RepID=F6W940_CIOIN